MADCGSGTGTPLADKHPLCFEAFASPRLSRKRARRCRVRFAQHLLFFRLSPAGRDASAASREGRLAAEVRWLIAVREPALPWPTSTRSASRLSPLRVSPASGRDDVVFASLTTFSSSVSPASGRDDVVFASLTTFSSSVSPASGRDDVVFASLSTCSSSVSPASGRDDVVFASLTTCSSSVSPLRGETRAQRAERGGSDGGGRCPWPVFRLRMPCHGQVASPCERTSNTHQGMDRGRP